MPLKRWYVIALLTAKDQGICAVEHKSSFFDCAVKFLLIQILSRRKENQHRSLSAMAFNRKIYI